MAEQPQDKKQYSLTDIEQYLEGKLSPAAMHELEKASLQDGFLADAIEGYQSANLISAREDLNRIHSQLFANNNKPETVIPLFTKRNRWWQVAAALLLFAGTGLLGWYFTNRSSDRKETAQLQRPVIQQKKDTIEKTQKTVIAIHPLTEKKAAKKAIPANAVADSFITASVPHSPDTSLIDKQLTETVSTGIALEGKGMMVNKIHIAKALHNDTSSSKNMTASTGAVMLLPKDSVHVLHDIVVVGYGTARKKDLAGAVSALQVDTAEKMYVIVPVGGWNGFNKYLINRLSLSKNDTTTVKFGSITAKLTLNQSGKVTKAKIIATFNKQLNKRIIKAIKEGPLWIRRGQNDENDFTVTIKL